MTRKKDKRWYYRIPGNFYAYGPSTYASKQELKDDIKSFLGVKRLPRGTEIWRTND